MTLLEAARALLALTDEAENLDPNFAQQHNRDCQRVLRKLRAAISAEEARSAGPVTAEEIEGLLNPLVRTPSDAAEARRIAALVAERTASAVEAARRSEREACARVADAEAERWNGDREEDRLGPAVTAAENIAAVIREREAPQPTPRVTPEDFALLAEIRAEADAIGERNAAIREEFGLDAPSSAGAVLGKLAALPDETPEGVAQRASEEMYERDHTPQPDPIPQAGCTCLACEQLRDYQRRGVANAWRRRDAHEARVRALVTAAEREAVPHVEWLRNQGKERCVSPCARCDIRAALDALGKEGT